MSKTFKDSSIPNHFTVVAEDNARKLYIILNMKTIEIGLECYSSPIVKITTRNPMVAFCIYVHSQFG